ncbi:MAG: M48 family metallopeptidase [Verrucomicrobiota bacterium]
MDFFQAQDDARKRSAVLVVLFVGAVICIMTALYGAGIWGIHTFRTHTTPPSIDELERSIRTNTTYSRTHQLELWNATLFSWVFFGVGSLVAGCSFSKIYQLRAGGSYVARSVGGKQVMSKTRDPDERKLLNIVEEMSIASGVPMPAVFVMEESGINGFAAGFETSDAAIAITRGCIQSLNRDELQGVVAHEFSHILNGDMKMNIRLCGVLFGILVIAVVGRTILRFTWDVGSFGGTRRGGGLVIVIAFVGFVIMAIGYIGVFFGRLIQSAISRQREFLADAAAVQFTRNPTGISGALKKIGGTVHQGLVRNPHVEELAHFFFANALRKTFGGSFSTHPPLSERIRSIEPSWDGKFIRTKLPEKKVDKKRVAKIRKTEADKPKDFINQIGVLSAGAITYAQDLRREIDNHISLIQADERQALASIFALQIKAGQSNRDTEQFEIIRRAIGNDYIASVQDWLAKVRSMDLDQRMALLEIALPQAAGKDHTKLSHYKKTLVDLAHHDGEVSLEELAVLRIMLNYMEGVKGPRRSFRALPPAKLQRPVDVILSVLANSASHNPQSVRAAFNTGAKKCNRFLLRRAEFLTLEQIKTGDLEDSLDTLYKLNSAQKRTIFEGALEVVLHDGKVEEDELAMIRLLAASMNLPMPPLRRAED